MNALVVKELKIATPIITYIFLAFALMTFIPNYPILVGSFFICLGIFKGYELGREGNDILYSVLLPVRKRDVVSAKFKAACIIEVIAFVIIAIFSAIRMLFLSGIGPYAFNNLMNPNLYFLGCVLLIFTVFNVFFIGSFFKTAYKVGIPFVIFCIITAIVISAAEILHHIPGLNILNGFTPDALLIQGIFLICATIVFIGLTLISCHIAKSRFEKIDI